MKKNMKKNMSHLLSSRNERNIENQLYFNNILKNSTET